MLLCDVMCVCVSDKLRDTIVPVLFWKEWGGVKKGHMYMYMHT